MVLKYTVIKNFGFPPPKHSGRQLLRKFRVQKFYPKLRVFEPKLWVFEPKLRVFEPKLRVCKLKLRVFQTETLAFRTKISGFWKVVRFAKIFFVLPKLRVLIPGFFTTETSGYPDTREILEVSGENKWLCKPRLPNFGYLVQFFLLLLRLRANFRKFMEKPRFFSFISLQHKHLVQITGASKLKMQWVFKHKRWLFLIFSKENFKTKSFYYSKGISQKKVRWNADWFDLGKAEIRLKSRQYI
jgi:hypothetical protein